MFWNPVSLHKNARLLLSLNESIVILFMGTPFDSQAGHPWFSILTRTGVFRGKDNHAEFPADLVSSMLKF